MSFETERRRWDRECDEVAAQLVREGVHPSKAIRSAQNIVSGRRAGRKIADAFRKRLQDFEVSSIKRELEK